MEVQTVSAGAGGNSCCGADLDVGGAGIGPTIALADKLTIAATGFVEGFPMTREPLAAPRTYGGSKKPRNWWEQLDHDISTAKSSEGIESIGK